MTARGLLNSRDDIEISSIHSGKPKMDFDEESFTVTANQMVYHDSNFNGDVRLMTTETKRTQNLWNIVIFCCVIGLVAILVGFCSLYTYQNLTELAGLQ